MDKSKFTINDFPKQKIPQTQLGSSEDGFSVLGIRSPAYRQLQLSASLKKLESSLRHSKDFFFFLKIFFQNTPPHKMSLPFSNQPPAERVPYAIPQLEGERITIPGSKGVFRILTSSKQTNGLMAVFQSGATVSDAPGFHYHEKAHDVFLVTKGYLKLWNGPQCRILGPGDFAYIPPVCTLLAVVFARRQTNCIAYRLSFTTPRWSVPTRNFRA